MILLGLMSGTSMDGIDAALLELEGDTPEAVTWELVGFHTRPYASAEREALARAVEGGGTAEALCRLHADLGGWLAEAALDVCRSEGLEPERVAAVGSHGHTVWHAPPTDGGSGATLQLGDPARLAEATGIPVVSDFRARDVAAGGHGAPLVPFADRILFSAPGRARALQNLGGMGNVTWLAPRGDPAPPEGFDTGPGVALLDAAARMATGGEWACDRDGALASQGAVDEGLLDRLLDHPFFHEVPPRSTGREAFGTPLVRELARGLEVGRREQWTDLIATLTALTARSVGRAYRRWIEPRGVDEVFLTGGGASNPVLRRAVEAELSPLPVRPGSELGLDPNAREAAAFAVLAWAHLRGVPANVPGVTGAAGPRVLGSLTPGRAVGE